jgi:hypothetical protein
MKAAAAPIACFEQRGRFQCVRKASEQGDPATDEGRGPAKGEGKGAAKGDDARALRALATALPELERQQARLLTACAQQARLVAQRGQVGVVAGDVGRVRQHQVEAPAGHWGEPVAQRELHPIPVGKNHIAAARRRSLLDFDETIARLRVHGFRIAEALLVQARTSLGLK